MSGRAGEEAAPSFVSQERHFDMEFVVKVPCFGTPEKHDPLETLQAVVRLSFGDEAVVERRRRRNGRSVS